MKKPGEKGKCLTCNHFSCGATAAWCHANQMRLIFTNPYLEEDKEFVFNENMPASVKARGGCTSLGIQKLLEYKNTFETLKKMEKKVNPSWCPLRNG